MISPAKRATEGGTGIGFHWRPARVLTIAGALLLAGSSLQAAFVQALDDSAWDSGDTRANGYLNLNNPPDSQLVRGRPRADNSGLLEDTLIAPRLSFGTPTIPPPRGPGAAHFVTSTAGDAATLENRTFAAMLSDPTLSFEYSWLRVSDGSPTVAAPALKLGIETSEGNPVGDRAADTGESRFDKILVYEPYLQSPTTDDTWTPEVIDVTFGMFWLVNLSGSSAVPATNQGDLRTLDEWATAFGNADLLTSEINSLQLGVGGGNPELEAYVDYLDFSSATGNDSWNFGVPEPTGLALLMIGCALLPLFRRRKSRA